MNKLVVEIETKNTYDAEEVLKINEIFKALIDTGGLIGMKNGSTQIHFNDKGEFMRIKLEYFPWRRKK